VTTETRGEQAATAPAVPASTGSTTTRVLGAVVLAGAALWAFLGMVATPEDAIQHEAVRLIYVHVPVVTVAYLACLVTSVASAVWLWRRSQWWDLVAASTAEIGALFTGLTLFSGMVWGRPTWGVFWVWDARLTSTLMLFLLQLGYLAIRRIPASPEVRGKRSAIVGLLLLPNVFIVNRSVEWWRSLHQDATLFRLDYQPLEDSMKITIVLGMVVGLLTLTWLTVHRFRVGFLQDSVDERALAGAVDARRTEAGAAGGLAALPLVLAVEDGAAVPYVAAGWAVTVGAVALYALAVLRKGRQLAAEVPPEERRWM
jgi:heme exporter protein C